MYVYIYVCMNVWMSCVCMYNKTNIYQNLMELVVTINQTDRNFFKNNSPWNMK